MYPVLKLQQLLSLNCSCQYLYKDFFLYFPRIEPFHIFLFRVCNPSELFPHTGESEIIDNIALVTIAIEHVII